MQWPAGSTIGLLLSLVSIGLPAMAMENAGGSWVNRPGSRSLLHAHNCYPNHGMWADRIDRALGTGFPVLIEQDLAWHVDEETGRGRSIVSHGRPYSMKDPTLRAHFFDRVRPIVEKALRSGDKSAWPILVLHLEFKTSEPDHVAAVGKLIDEHGQWFCWAEKVSDETKVMPIQAGPVLAITEGGARQKKIFYDDVATGGRIRVFGNVPARRGGVNDPPEKICPSAADNYHRWWNNSWAVVETGGQRFAGPWTEADQARLKALVDHAHRMGLWIRFYTLNGHAAGDARGWSGGYNFGSPAAVRARWRAALEAGVDFIATDQYETFAAFRDEWAKARK